MLERAAAITTNDHDDAPGCRLLRRAVYDEAGLVNQNETGYAQDDLNQNNGNVRC